MEAVQRPVHPWVAEGARRVRFGIDLGPLPTGAATIEWAQAIEELGFDSFWLRDHPARASEDPFTYLAAIAAVTRRIRLGTLVACVQFRHPVLLARVAADVDRLSGGRLVLGLGAGWDRTEFAQMDLPLPPSKDRLDALEETLQLLPRLWGDEPVSYEGRHLKVAGARVQSGPVQRRVPILVGGGGERRTLRLVAQYADACNTEGNDRGSSGAWTPKMVAHKHSVLSQHCAAVGRTAGAILRTHFRYPLVVAETPGRLQEKLDLLPPDLRESTCRVVGTPREVVDTLRSLIGAGVQYFIFIAADLDSARLLAERVIPEVEHASGLTTVADGIELGREQGGVLQGTSNSTRLALRPG
jgi:alkanesulfonate monooxygenase SsuD/methylene tetrahydromethanopterin reductase-like flavin-dependent oxidoreductase (luciferase family)